MSLDLIAASATFPGLATTGTQTFAGAKTFTGVVTLADGSVSAPSLAFGGASSNTGWYLIGTDNIGLASNGLKTIDVSSAGAIVMGPQGILTLAAATKAATVPVLNLVQREGNSLWFGHSNSAYNGILGGYTSGGPVFMGAYFYHSNSADVLRRSGTNGPTMIKFLDTGGASFFTDGAGTLDATWSATEVGGFNSAGAWAFGSGTATSNIQHIFQGTTGTGRHTTLMVQGSASANSLSVLAAGTQSSEYCALIFDRNISETFLWANKSGSAKFRFVSTTDNSWTSLLTSQAGYLECGSFNVNTGAWTFGSNTGTADSQHNYNTYTGSGTASNTFNERNSANDFAARILHARTSGTYLAFRFFDGSSDNCGDISVNTTANTTAYNTSSDARLKCLPEQFSGLNILLNITPRKYERLSEPGKTEFGMYAQELFEAYPQAVSVGGEDVKSNPWMIDYSKLTPVLAMAIKELSAKNDNLELRIRELEVCN